MKKIPSGISDLDTIIKGGFPSGSVILLLNEIGAGGLEFTYTSSAKLLMSKDSPDDLKLILGDECMRSILPEDIHYLTFSRAKEDILDEVKMSFNQDYYDAVESNLNFKDFSQSFFRQTIVPRGWTGNSGKASIFQNDSNGDILEELVDFLDRNATNNVVIIDSLTDLLTNSTIDNEKLVNIVRGIRRASKKWDGVVYLHLSRGIVEPSLEHLLIDSVHGVLLFEWSKSYRSSQRQRYLTVQKFMSVLPHLKREKVARFMAEVSALNGYHVINYETIR